MQEKKQKDAPEGVRLTRTISQWKTLLRAFDDMNPNIVQVPLYDLLDTRYPFAERDPSVTFTFKKEAADWMVHFEETRKLPKDAPPMRWCVERWKFDTMGEGSDFVSRSRVLFGMKAHAVESLRLMKRYAGMQGDANKGFFLSDGERGWSVLQIRKAK